MTRANLHQAQIGFVSYPEAKVSPITHDTSTYSDVSIAANGLALVTILSEEQWNLFVTPGSGAQAHAVGTARANTNFSWTADGQLIGDQGNVLTRIDPATGKKTAITPKKERRPVTFRPAPTAVTQCLNFFLPEQRAMSISGAPMHQGAI